MFGIIGPTGSGKSSLVQLIPRLYDTTAGTVRVGGHDVREYRFADLRQKRIYGITKEYVILWNNS